MRIRLLTALLPLALIACRGGGAPTPSSGGSDTAQEAVSRIGDVTIRATAVPTTTLREPGAPQYGNTRADSTVMLLIGVRQGSDAQEVALPARITATVSDLRGRRQDIAMRELRSGELLDYVGTVEVSPPETLRFDLTVVRDGGASSTMQFTRDFYPR